MTSQICNLGFRPELRTWKVDYKNRITFWYLCGQFVRSKHYPRFKPLTDSIIINWIKWRHATRGGWWIVECAFFIEASSESYTNLPVFSFQSKPSHFSFPVFVFFIFADSGTWNTSSSSSSAFTISLLLFYITYLWTWSSCRQDLRLLSQQPQQYLPPGDIVYPQSG